VKLLKYWLLGGYTRKPEGIEHFEEINVNGRVIVT
jgi:hypothetical protein